jgi:serine/threonine protein kinase/tetratricopeptide (TPR) repeat protein
MSEPSAELQDREQRLDEVVFQYLREAEAGRAPDRRVWLARYPEWAAELAEFFANQDRIDGEAAPLRSLIGPVPSPLGDFRLLREVGRGGMGVVYEAEQMSLGRRVALKVLPFAATLDPKQLQRFKNEAQAAALLQHQHIVPVYFVGCERGVHFYAMQFIEGQTLAAVIGELRRLAGKEETGSPGSPEQLSAAARALAAGCLPEPSPRPDEEPKTTPYTLPPESPPPETTPRGGTTTEHSITNRAYFRTVARLGEQAAEALEHAHEMGVIHRDVKPANLLIDARANVWITDFGLAHCQNQAGLTMTGDFLGTLRYVSPEQALAKRVLVDHRTDVYSLGATLYELLALEPAFPGTDREELLRQIAFEEPRPLHRWNKAIPRELETIVHKALEKSPADRYTTAHELADDLRRWLEDRPIQARRPTLVQRFAKWGRRHRTLVGAGIVVLVLTAVVALVAAAMIWSFYQREAKALAAEAKQRREADAKKQFARQAAEDMYTQVADKWLANEPRLTDVQRTFLLKALYFYQELAREEGEDETVRFDVARARGRVGMIEKALGHHDVAEREFRQALTELKELVARVPGHPVYRRDLAATSFYLAELLVQLGRLPEAEQFHRSALSLRESLAGEFPTEPYYRLTAATSSTALGTTLQLLGRLDEAERAFLLSVEWVEKLMAQAPADPRYLGWLSDSLHNLAVMYGSTRRFAEADKACQRIIPHLRKFAATSPGDSQNRKRLAIGLVTWANVLRELGRRDAAEQAYREALEGFTRMALDFPEVPDHRNRLASTYVNLGLLLQESNPKEADEAFRNALEHYERLAKDYPAVPDYPSRLGATLHNYGGLVLGRGDPAEARRLFERAIPYQRRALDTNPRNSAYRQFLINHYASLAGILVQQGDHVEAARQTRAFVALGPDRWFDYQRAADVLTHCAVLASKDETLPIPQREAVAQEYQTEIKGYLPEILKRVGEDPEQMNQVSWYLSTRTEPRIRDHLAAVPLARKATEKNGQKATYWNTLGVAHYRAGDGKAAIEALKKSMGLSKGGSAEDWLFLAMAHWKLDHKIEARTWYDKSARWMEQNGAALAKNAEDAKELGRFRAEAAELLGIQEELKSKNQGPTPERKPMK